VRGCWCSAIYAGLQAHRLTSRRERRISQERENAKASHGTAGLSVPPQERPPSWQQGPWPPQPPPPLPAKDNTVKWLLIAVAILLVITVSVGATLYFTRDSGNGGSTTASPAVASDVASANDTGPVAIITEDPTCEALNAINSRMAEVQGNGWGEHRRSLGPASEWTSDQRSEVEVVTTAIRNAADQMVDLAKHTPHRLARELYEQAIAYGRAYLASIPNYKSQDDFLATVYVSAGNAMQGICNAIRFGSASRSLAIEPAPPPSKISHPADSKNPRRFLETRDTACGEWLRAADQFSADTVPWAAVDANIPGSRWSPEQRAIHGAALPFFSKHADTME